MTQEQYLAGLVQCGPVSDADGVPSLDEAGLSALNRDLTSWIAGRGYRCEPAGGAHGVRVCFRPPDGDPEFDCQRCAAGRSPSLTRLEAPEGRSRS